MDDKLNRAWAVRVSDDAYEGIINLPWAKRKRMNNDIRDLIERTIRSETILSVPTPCDTVAPDQVSLPSQASSRP